MGLFLGVRLFVGGFFYHFQVLGKEETSLKEIIVSEHVCFDFGFFSCSH